MAIVKCPDCRADVSTRATRCPRCGRSEQTPLSLMMAGLFLVFNVTMALGLVLELSVWLVQGRVVSAWATGSVILGVLALVTRRHTAVVVVRSQRDGPEKWPPLTPEEKGAVDRASARRKAGGERTGAADE